MRCRPIAAALALLLPTLAVAQEVVPPRPVPARPAAAQPVPQQGQGPRSLLDRRAAPPPPPAAAQQPAAIVPPRLPPQQQPRPAALAPLPPIPSPQPPRQAAPAAVVPPPASPAAAATRPPPPPPPAAALRPPPPPQAQQPPRPAPAALPVPPPQYPGQAPGQRPKPVPRIGDRLHETRWRIETIQGRPVVRGKEPTLEFLRDDHLRGGSGCNRFVGPWQTRANRAVLGPLRRSRMSCGPELDRQEQQLMDTLEHSERLEFQNEGRTLLVYSSLSKAPSRFTKLP